MAVVISGTGLYTPTQSISNDELVHCFNQYVEKFNLTHSQEIENGEIDALSPSNSSFIEKASGIKKSLCHGERKYFKCRHYVATLYRA